MKKPKKKATKSLRSQTPRSAAPRTAPQASVLLWKNGYRHHKVSAEVAHAALADISSANDGLLRPKDIVDSARPQSNALHPIFDWDDSTAAEAYRREQARGIVQNLIIVVSTNGDQSSGPLYISIPAHDDHHRGYATTDVVIKNQDMRTAALAEARSGYEAWHARYQWLDELHLIFAAAEHTWEVKKLRKKAG